MTHLSSKTKSTNRISYNTSTVLTLPFSLLWRTIRRMGSSPSWTPLLNQRLMGNCLSLYRKPTHTDQCLQWNSHHHLSATFSVIHTLFHRAQTVCNNPELLHKEKTHLRNTLTQCKYPKWDLDNVERKLNKLSSETSDGAYNQETIGAQPATKEVKTKGHIVITYTQGLCESIKKISGRYGIQTYFKGSNTIRNLLVSPKDKVPMVSQSGAIYWFQCGDLSCDDEYIRETSRTLGERYKEHLKDPSPIHQHSNHTGLPISHNNFQILGKEGHSLARYIKESIFIRVNNPTLNRNIGKFNLPHTWGRVLLKTPGLNLKRHVHAVGHADSNNTNNSNIFLSPFKLIII